MPKTPPRHFFTVAMSSLFTRSVAFFRLTRQVRCIFVGLGLVLLLQPVAVAGQHRVELRGMNILDIISGRESTVVQVERGVLLAVEGEAVTLRLLGEGNPHRLDIDPVVRCEVGDDTGGIPAEQFFGTALSKGRILREAGSRLGEVALVSPYNQDPCGWFELLPAVDPALEDAQRRLGEGGFSPGPADGRYGPRTLEAIDAFQRSKGLDRTGWLDEATADALGVTTAQEAEAPEPAVAEGQAPAPPARGRLTDVSSRVEGDPALRPLVQKRVQIAVEQADLAGLDAALATMRRGAADQLDSEITSQTLRLNPVLESPSIRAQFAVETLLPYLYPSTVGEDYECIPVSGEVASTIGGGVRSVERYSRCSAGAETITLRERQVPRGSPDGRAPFDSLVVETPHGDVAVGSTTLVVRAGSAAGHTLMTLAATAGSTRVMDVLLNRGASLESRGEGGRTALHRAVEAGRLESAQWLMAAGADVDPLDTQGLTPLHTALRAGNREIADLLLQGGADVNARAADGATPLLFAVSNSVDMVDGLLANGADVEARDGDGRTALMIAIVRGRNSTVRALVDAGADVSVADPSGITPLMLAVRDGSDLVPVLLTAGSQVNLADSAGRTALHYAVEGARTGNVEALLKGGADPNILTSDGDSPLMLAAAAGMDDLVVTLLRSGAKRGIRNQAGQTAEDAARARSRGEVVGVFRHSKAVHFTIPKIAANLARLDDPQHASSVGLELGFSFAIRLRERIRVQADLGLVARSTDPDDHSGPVILPPNGDFYYWIEHLELRPALRIALGNPYRTHPYLLVGGGLGSASSIELRDWTDSAEGDGDVADRSDEDLVSKNVGLGLEWVAGTKILTMELLYSHVSDFRLDRFQGPLDALSFSLGLGW